MKHKKNTRKGTSILELILFVGITAMMTGAILSFSLLSTQVGMREEIIADVEHGGLFVTELISRKIQAADNVSVAGNELTLGYPTGPPIVISLDSGKIKMKNGGDVSYITPENLEVSDLDFVLLGGTEANKDGVTISFKLSNNPVSGAAQFFNYDQQFHVTVAGR